MGARSKWSRISLLYGLGVPRGNPNFPFPFAVDARWRTCTERSRSSLWERESRIFFFDLPLGYKGQCLVLTETHAEETVWRHVSLHSPTARFGSLLGGTHCWAGDPPSAPGILSAIPSACPSGNKGVREPLSCRFFYSEVPSE